MIESIINGMDNFELASIPYTLEKQSLIDAIVAIIISQRRTKKKFGTYLFLFSISSASLCWTAAFNLASSLCGEIKV